MRRANQSPTPRNDHASPVPHVIPNEEPWPPHTLLGLMPISTRVVYFKAVSASLFSLSVWISAMLQLIVMESMIDVAVWYALTLGAILVFIVLLVAFAISIHGYDPYSVLSTADKSIEKDMNIHIGTVCSEFTNSFATIMSQLVVCHGILFVTVWVSYRTMDATVGTTHEDVPAAVYRAILSIAGRLVFCGTIAFVYVNWIRFEIWMYHTNSELRRRLSQGTQETLQAAKEK